MPFDLGPAATLWMAVAIFAASFVRGYSGFGFAALVVSAASLVTNPLLFVPVVIVADVVLTAQQARNIWPDIEWRRVVTLFAGCLIGVPLGILILSRIGVDAARAAISVYILAMCAVLLTGRTLRRPAGDAAHVATGVFSGIANGAAIGGLPVAAFFAAQSIPAAAFRATLIAYFTGLDIWTLPLLGWSGLITRDTFLATALGLPLMIAGVWAGSRHFLSAAPQDFRRFAIFLLAALAVMGLVKSLW
jgi:uncharacterized protein